MGGTSIWMSRRGRHSSTAGSPEWNERRSLDHQARCWVLKERLRRTFTTRVLAPAYEQSGWTPARTLRTAQWTRASSLNLRIQR